MTTNISLDQLKKMKGKDVYSSENEKIGGIEEIFIDEQTRQPEWLALSGSRTLGASGKVLVPVENAEIDGDGVRVPYSKELISTTPQSISGDRVDEETERRLYEHYGLQYSHAPSETGLPAGRGGGMPMGTRHEQETEGDVTMTRSEEELRVGKRDVDAGTFRLRKYVETEPVSEDVELRRETVDIERQDINQPVSGGQLGDQQAELSLRAEEPVVQKDTVAREQVTARKRNTSEQATVREDVRRERIETEGGERDHGTRGG